MSILVKSKRKRKENIDGWIFMLPVVILGLIFFVYPAVQAFYLSFHKYSLLCPQPEFVGLKNYITAFHDGIFMRAIINTFLYAIGVVPLQLIIALFLAIIVNSKIKAKGFFRTAYYIPTVTSAVAVAIIFMFLFKNDGIINSIINLFGVKSIVFFDNPNLALPTIMIMTIWASVGIYMVIFLAGLQNISPTLYEAAQIDGANKFHQFWYITVPMLKPTIFFNLVVSTIGTLQVFDQAYIVSGGDGGPLNSTMTMVLYLYNMGFKSFQMGYACAIAFILFIMILILTVIQKLIFKDNEEKA